MATRESDKLLNQRNILVVCPDRGMLGELLPLLSQLLPLTPVSQINHYLDKKALADLVATNPPALCFLDVASRPDLAFSLITDLCGLIPGLPIVVLLGSDNPDVILSCLRQGASEFLIQPFTSEQLDPALQRISQLNPNAIGVPGGAKVLAVIPVKGACGASTIACSLAYQWKRLGMKNTLLADMDSAAGTVSFLLKHKSTYSFLDALNRAGALDGDLWKGIVSSVHGIDVLLSPESSGDASPDTADPAFLIDFCRQAYEHVTLDLGGPFSRWSLSLASLASEVLLVTTNELPALRAAQRVLQFFEVHHVDQTKVRLVVNRYNPDVGLNQEAIETALHCEVFHVLPSDYEAVQRALVEGKPIVPGSGFGKSLATLAERVAGKRTTDAKKKKAGSWTSIFSSLVSRRSSA